MAEGGDGSDEDDFRQVPVSQHTALPENINSVGLCFGSALVLADLDPGKNLNGRTQIRTQYAEKC
jgi:hypothetical protein